MRPFCVGVYGLVKRNEPTSDFGVRVEPKGPEQRYGKCSHRPESHNA